MRLFLTLLCVALGVLILAGFLGGLHPLGDSLAIFRRQMAVALAVCAGGLMLYAPRWGWLALGVAVATGWTTVHLLPQSAVWDDMAGKFAPIGVYQKNMLFRMQNRGPLVADIRALDPEIIALQEVSARLQPILDDLAETHPYHAICSFHSVIGDVVLLSKWPMSETVCIDRSGFVAARLEAPGGPIWAVSVHLHWPYPYHQAEQVAEILPTLEAKIDGEVIVAGDFNMVPWGRSLARIAQATGTRRHRILWSTLDRFEPLFPFPIDHVLSTGTAHVSKRPRLGSDHNGVFARVLLDPI